MKTYFYLTLICLSFFYSLSAQTDIIGYERYDSFEQFIYIDNLDQRLIPEIFNTTYYFKLKESEFKVDSQVIDTIHQKREIYVYSKKVKDGYLLVNKKIMDKIKDLNCNLNELKVSYAYNGETVSTKEEVNRILRLKEKNILVSINLQDERSKVISVCILDK